MIKHGSFLILLLMSGILFQSQTLFGQSKAEIQNVDFNVDRDQLIVTYDIIKAKSNERFNISIIVRTISGITYNPKAVTGDVGENVFGGKGKRIVWDIAKDNVFIEDEIFVEVKPVPTTDVQPAVTKTEPLPQQPQQQQPQQQLGSWAEERTFPKGGAIALSAIFPGIGITKQKEGGPYWLMGIATYGLAITGIILNVSSNSSYTKYQDATTTEDRDKYYNQAKSRVKTGNTLFYVAAGIWAGNMVWTILTPNKKKIGGFSFIGSYDPFMETPVFGVKYKF